MLISHAAHNNRGYINMTPEELALAGVPAGVIATAAGADIIRAAEEALRAMARMIFTADATQATIYSAKYDEARAYKAASYPGTITEADYPFVTHEAPARGLTKQAFADLIIEKGDAWRILAAKLEAARAAIAAAVEEAETIDEKQAAAAAIVDPLRAEIEAAA